MTRLTIRQHPEQFLVHEAEIRRLTRSLVDDDAALDDVLQETWLRALQHDLERPEAARSWLTRIARNLAILQLRSDSRRKCRERVSALGKLESAPSRFRAQEAQRRRVVEAVLSLPEPHRSCLLARYFDDLPPREIARRNEVPVATVRSRLRRGRELLRQELGSGKRKGDVGPFQEGGFTDDLVGVGFSFGCLESGGQGLRIVATQGIPAVPSLTKGVAVMTTKLKIGLALGILVLPASLIPLCFSSASSESETSHGSVLAETTGDGAGPHDVAGFRGRSSRSAAEASNRARRRDENGGRSGQPGVSDPSVTSQSGSTFEDQMDGEFVGSSGTALEVEVRSTYQRLRDHFVAGGWLAVKDRIGEIRQLLGTEEGVEMFLSLLDAEDDAFFVEALLHHLVRPGSTGALGLEAILSNTDFHDALWQRFEEETDSRMRASLLSFFNQNPRLRSARMDEFVNGVSSEGDPRVRAAQLEALREMADREEVWPLLCHVAEGDPDEGCRAMAIHGLVGLEHPRALAAVRAAFESDSEVLRAAAWESGAEPPVGLVGPDLPDYLRWEYRSAETNAYKAALIDRLIETDSNLLTEELGRQLTWLPVGSEKSYYEAVLATLAGGEVEDRWDVRRQTRELYLRFRYGGG